VTEALARVSPELWTPILESDGFAESVAQDDLRQVTSALEAVSAHLWADILRTNGAFEAINWKNFPELTASLRKHEVPVETWARVLDMSTPDVYEAIFNDAMAVHAGKHIV
jgi:hypothetical protein